MEFFCGVVMRAGADQQSGEIWGSVSMTWEQEELGIEPQQKGGQTVDCSYNRSVFMYSFKGYLPANKTQAFSMSSFKLGFKGFNRVFCQQGYSRIKGQMTRKG